MTVSSSFCSHPGDVFVPVHSLTGQKLVRVDPMNNLPELDICVHNRAKVHLDSIERTQDISLTLR